jgi:hypothetical protein
MQMQIPDDQLTGALDTAGAAIAKLAKKFKADTEEAGLCKDALLALNEAAAVRKVELREREKPAKRVEGTLAPTPLPKTPFKTPFDRPRSVSDGGRSTPS